MVKPALGVKSSQDSWLETLHVQENGVAGGVTAFMQGMFANKGSARAASQQLRSPPAALEMVRRTPV